ncbi:MAG: hypothetical protein M0R80_08365 [Proteobacteria bacterium]|nr:hypothetical protein [Pseudomonadota bacterium]
MKLRFLGIGLLLASLLLAGCPKPTPPGPPEPTVNKLNVVITGSSPEVVRDLTPDQVAILTSRTVRDWMDASCEKAEDGLPAYRLIAKSVGAESLPDRWKTMVAMVPADAKGITVVATNGKKKLVVPLPADFTALLKTVSDFAKLPMPAVSSAKEPNPPVFTDEEWAKFNPPDKVAEFGGEKRFLSCMPRDLKKYPLGKAPGTTTLAAVGVRVIPRSEWPARLEALKKANAGVMPLIYGKVEGHDQDGTNYCWANSAVCAGGNVKYIQGQSPYILSAASVGGPITGYRNQGGWPGDAVAFMEKTGAVRADLWPNIAIKSSYAKKPECVADYSKHKILAKSVDLGESGNIFDETATCVLLGSSVAVTYNWWSHAVTAVGLEQKDGKWYLILRNSWGDSYGDKGFFKLPEGRGSNRGTPDDAQAVFYMTFN